MLSILKRHARHGSKNTSRDSLTSDNSEMSSNSCDPIAYLSENEAAFGNRKCFQKVVLKNFPYGVPWVLDDSIGSCMVCLDHFSMFKWKHHCRICGNLVCNSCSKSRVYISILEEQGGSRMCDTCVDNGVEVNRPVIDKYTHKSKPVLSQPINDSLKYQIRSLSSDNSQRNVKRHSGVRSLSCDDLMSSKHDNQNIIPTSSELSHEKKDRINRGSIFIKDDFKRRELVLKQETIPNSQLNSSMNESSAEISIDSDLKLICTQTTPPTSLSSSSRPKLRNSLRQYVQYIPSIPRIDTSNENTPEFKADAAEVQIMKEQQKQKVASKLTSKKSDKRHVSRFVKSNISVSKALRRYGMWEVEEDSVGATVPISNNDHSKTANNKSDQDGKENVVNRNAC